MCWKCRCQIYCASRDTRSQESALLPFQNIPPYFGKAVQRVGDSEYSSGLFCSKCAWLQEINIGVGTATDPEAKGLWADDIISCLSEPAEPPLLRQRPPRSDRCAPSLDYVTFAARVAKHTPDSTQRSRR